MALWRSSSHTIAMLQSNSYWRYPLTVWSSLQSRESTPKYPMGKFRCSSPANNLSFLVRGTWSQTGPGTCLEPSSDSTTTTRTDRKGFHPRRCAQSRILLPWLASRKQTYDYCLWMFNVRMFPKSSVQVLVTMETRLEPNAIAIWHELRNADAWKKTWNFGKA